MNILFWVRKNYITRKGTAQIICTLSIDGKKIDIGTKLAIEPKNWKQAKQKAYGENSLYINEALSKIKTTLIQIKQNFELKGQIYTLQDIKNEFLGKNTKIEVKSYKTTILQDLEKVQTIRAKNNSETTNHRDKSYFRKIKQFLEKSNLHDKPSEQITKVDIEVV
jgi:MFS superfamily sulfate permease-like transporter